MKRVNFRNLVLGLAMLAAAGLAVAMKPTIRVADQGPKVDLETMIPKAFGDWRVDESIVPLLPDPKQTALLNKLYNQILSRTYMNARGERVMLSIAYGGDQSDSMLVHRPEICYPAQGFQVIKQVSGSLVTAFGAVPVQRLVARQGARVEPITYWITVGDRVAVTGWARKMAQLTYGFTGRVPDGILVRVSTIGEAEAMSFTVQQAFVDALLSSAGQEGRLRLVGSIF